MISQAADGVNEAEKRALRRPSPTATSLREAALTIVSLRMIA